MKRSEINTAIRQSFRFFHQNGWALPPHPKWDITDFGLGNYPQCGLLLVNLCEEPEYCEKLMYATHNQETPLHYHLRKKEDIICRTGTLIVNVWNNRDGKIDPSTDVQLKINGVLTAIQAGNNITLKAGERITLTSGIWHSFYPDSSECIIGEVSTANDDHNDNFFLDRNIGRFTEIEEDEPPIAGLVNDKSSE